MIVKGFVSEMTYYVLSGTLNPTHTLTHSLKGYGTKSIQMVRKYSNSCNLVALRLLTTLS